METASQPEKKSVTYADLDRAADAALAAEDAAEIKEPVVEEQPEETVETAAEEESQEASEEQEEPQEEATEEVAAVEEEAIKVRDEENAERSRLGRKVKGLEDSYGQLSDRIDRLLDRLEAGGTDNTAEEEDDADAFLTPENLPKYLERENNKRAKEQESYQRNFVREFQSIGGEDEDFDLIWDEFLKNHNQVVTSDPKADAQIGYYKAKNAVILAKKPEQPKIPGKAKSGTLKTDVNVPNKVQEKQPKPIKLDPIALDVVTNVSELKFLPSRKLENPLGMIGLEFPKWGKRGKILYYGGSIILRMIKMKKFQPLLRSFTVKEKKETNPGKVKELIKSYAESLGYIVGVTRLDRRFIINHDDRIMPYDTVIMLGMEMDFDLIEEIPYPGKRLWDFEIYRKSSLMVWHVAKYIRKMGYNCHAIIPFDGSVKFVPHAINAGMGEPLPWRDHVAAEVYLDEWQIYDPSRDSPLEKGIKKSRRTHITAAGHIVSMEKSDEINKTILRFLDQIGL